MTETAKVLGQLAPAATTLSTLYTVPAVTSAVGSSLVICNQGATPDNIRVAVRPAGAAIDPKHYLYYDVWIGASESLTATLGITLATTDVVSVYSGLGTTSFNLFGKEIT